jgi:hypothetical protein
MRNSPFAIFRRNQRQLMVVLTGLAMFAFIFLDSVSMRSGSLPRMFGVILVAMIFAAGLWVVGAPRGKGNEWALYGALLGAVAAYFGLRAPPNGVVVQTSIGSFTRQQFQDMGQRRAMANRFVYSATQGRVQGFGAVDDRALLHKAILQHEAQQRGITINDDGVLDFIKQVTEDKLALPDYQKTLRELGLPEAELFNILREELAAQLALQMTLPPAQQSGMGSLETPLTYWNQFRMLQVRQSLEAAPIPVQPFVTQVPEPTEIEIAQFFERHKNQMPTIDGQPGFLQDRRVQLAYLMADFETFERQVPEPTDEEITAYYEANRERYRVFEFPDEPLFTPFDDAPASALEPANVAPERPDSPGPALPDSGPAVPPAPDKPEDGAAARSTREIPVRLVSFQADADAAAQDQPATETPAAEDKPEPTLTPPADGPVTPTLTDMPELPPGSGSRPAEEPMYRELDDNLKSEIRDLLLKERAFENMGRAVDKAVDEMARQADKYVDAITADEKAQRAGELAEALKQYAAAQHLQYRETGLMTQRDLISSTSETIGAAQEPSLNPFQRGGNAVWQDAFENDSLYDVRRADSVLRDKRYAYWKIADEPAKVPDLKDVREQVAEAWKLEQARPLAERRAKELAEMARQAGQPLAEALAGQTISGTPGSDTITVRETPRFSWLNVPRNLPFQFNPMFSPPPELSPVEGIDGAGMDFMRTVFEDLGAGDVGVAPNQNRSTFYVVRVKQRDAAPVEGDENLGLRVLQQQFLTTGRAGFTQGAYMYLNRERLVGLLNNWNKDFDRTYEVSWVTPDADDEPLP